MYKITILGSGKIGTAIAKLLYHSGDYEVQVCDSNKTALEELSKAIPIETETLDVTNENDLIQSLKGQDAVVSACPYFVNVRIAKAALKTGISYFDLTEDVQTTRMIRALAQKASSHQVFVPKCGLAPGFISILAYALCQQFDQLDEVRLRVGALPQYPSNKLMYNLTWSTEGLINQYCNPCEAIYQGRKIEVMPLEDLEYFAVNGQEYEAFNTSGGLGTLWETLEGKVKSLNYKSIRHKGHRDLIAFLIRDLKLGDRRSLFKDILETAIPTTKQDVVLIFCTVKGLKNGQLMQVSESSQIYNTELFDEHWGAIQLSTAAGLCAVLDLFFAGKLPSTGFVKQEEVRLEAFKSNRFGKYYFEHHLD
ncbi:MAG: saccharopine dehydrogenase family protein [Chroococcales cyanobacterium]